MDLTAFDQLILEDAIEGSTFVDAAESDIGFDTTQQYVNAARRSYDNLTDKMRLAHTGA